jgi:hypothetical protein
MSPTWKKYCSKACERNVDAQSDLSVALGEGIRESSPIATNAPPRIRRALSLEITGVQITGKARVSGAASVQDFIDAIVANRGDGADLG